MLYLSNAPLIMFAFLMSRFFVFTKFLFHFLLCELDGTCLRPTMTIGNQRLIMIIEGMVCLFVCGRGCLGLSQNK